MGEVPLLDGGTYPATAITASDGMGVFVSGDAISTLR